MKVTVLASGSKGNCTLIETKNKNILIDAGITFSNIKKRLDVVPKIDYLLITHLHIDHIAGLLSIFKSSKCHILTPIKEVKDLDKKFLDNSLYKKIEDLEITFFPLSHDVECYGILIKENDKELVYITDTGYISLKNLNLIKNKDVYIMESNHDLDMLMNGKYPFYLKQRILGDSGHLSNESSSKYLKKSIGNKTKYIVLAHLSEENNKEEIAKRQLLNTIKKEESLTIYIAKQQEKLDMFEV